MKKSTIIGLAVFILYLILCILIMKIPYIQHLLEYSFFNVLFVIAWCAILVGLSIWIYKMVKKEQPDRKENRKQRIAYCCSIVIITIIIKVFERTFFKDFVSNNSGLLIFLYELLAIIIWSGATGLIIRKLFPDKDNEINE